MPLTRRDFQSGGMGCGRKQCRHSRVLGMVHVCENSEENPVGIGAEGWKGSLECRRRSQRSVPLSCCRSEGQCQREGVRTGCGRREPKD